MGIRPKQRVNREANPVLSKLLDVSASAPDLEPLVDVGTDEAQVVLRLGNMATTGDLGFDDSREWGELFPTIPTLIGALHLLPQAVQGRAPEETERLAEFFDQELDRQLGDHEGNLFERVLAPNAGMSNTYRLLRDERQFLGNEQRCHERNQLLLNTKGKLGRASDEWAANLQEGRRWRQKQLDAYNDLRDADLKPVAEKTRACLESFDSSGTALRRDLGHYIQGEGDYETMAFAARAWLRSFDELKAAVRAPNPKRQVEAVSFGEEAGEDSL